MNAGVGVGRAGGASIMAECFQKVAHSTQCENVIN